MAAQKKLFGNNIEPACIYCQFGRGGGPDNVMILCRKFGPVAPYYKCKKFIYDPLKRVPRPRPGMPLYTEDDFKL